MAIVYSFVTDQLKKAFEIMQNFTVYGTLSLFDFFICFIVIDIIVFFFTPILRVEQSHARFMNRMEEGYNYRKAKRNERQKKG